MSKKKNSPVEAPSTLELELKALGKGLSQFVNESLGKLDTDPLAAIQIRANIQELQLFFANQFLGNKCRELIETSLAVASPAPLEKEEVTDDPSSSPS